MTKDQEDTLNMYEAVDEVLQTFNAVWVGNVPFAAAVGEFEGNINDIEDLRDQQEEDTKGVTQDKQNKRQALEDQTFTIGSIIVFFASNTNNRKLLEKVNFTRTDLKEARDNELPGMSEQVHQEAVTNAVALLPYGVTPLLITALGNAIAAFVDYISKPRAALIETSAATEQLPPVFVDTDKVLTEKLDGGMELYRVSNNNFYTQYFNARIIVNSPTQKRALQAQFVDDVTIEAIARVNVTVNDTIKRRSSQLGNIRVQSLLEGAHTLKATLPGYVDVNQNFNVISGETTKLEVRMVKV